VKLTSALFALGALMLVLNGRLAAGADGPGDQKAPRSPAQAMPDGPGLGPGGGRFGPGYQRLLSVLSDEQKVSLRKAMDDQREKARELEEQFRNATRDLYAAGLATRFDEDAVREKALAAARAEAELSVLRFKAFSKMRPQLSLEQIARLREQSPERMGRPRLNGSGDATGPGSIGGELPRKLPARQHDENGLPVKQD
jgi:Spy/CpxP family protein refolding chaperone